MSAFKHCFDDAGVKNSRFAARPVNAASAAAALQARVAANAAPAAASSASNTALQPAPSIKQEPLTAFKTTSDSNVFSPDAKPLGRVPLPHATTSTTPKTSAPPTGKENSLSGHNGTTPNS